MPRPAHALLLCALACTTEPFPAAGGESTTTTGGTSLPEPPVTLDAVEADEGTSNASFLDPSPDAGNSLDECSTWIQDCPVGEKCMPYNNDGGNSWNATKCTRLDPDPAQPGEPCYVVESGVSGYDNCGVASMCWAVDSVTLEGTCVPLCVGSDYEPYCEDPETSCFFPSDGALFLCLPTCDPVLQDCASKGLQSGGCLPLQQSFVCSFLANQDGGGYGVPCKFVNVCDRGLFCANAAVVPGCTGGQGCCSEFCDLTDPLASAKCAGASQGQVCIPWFDEEEAPPFLAHVGACALPM